MDAWTEIYREEKNNLYFEMLLLYSQFLKRSVLFMNLGYNIQESGKPPSPSSSFIAFLIVSRLSHRTIQSSSTSSSSKSFRLTDLDQGR